MLREGSEVVLFLYGIVATGTSASALLTGGLLGFAAGAVCTALTYYGLLAIPARHIFTVTGILIALLAAGMAAQAVQFLDAAGMIDVLGHRMWDSSGWLPQDSMIGKLLHTLDRLYRPADRVAAHRLCRDARGDGGAHARRGAAARLRASRPTADRPHLPALRSRPWRCQHREGYIGCALNHLEQRARGAARATLALLPVAHGLDRDADAGGKLRLGELVRARTPRA